MEPPKVETVSAMRLGCAPRCYRCKSTETLVWERDLSRGVLLCAECTQRDRSATDDSASQGFRAGAVQRQAENFGVALNKMPRKVKGKNGITAAKNVKGRGRHTLAKKTPYKAPPVISTVVTTDFVYHKGTYYQLGDIVSLVDSDDGGIYYASIRGLLQDQYCEKSAVLTWLIPTTDSPETGFCPQSYVLGPEEDLPRKLDFMQFVCHSPSDYFKDRKSPYPTEPAQPEVACIWTSVGPRIIPRPSRKKMFGVSNDDEGQGSDKEGEKDKDEKKDKVKKKKKDSKKEAVNKDVKTEKAKIKDKIK